PIALPQVHPDRSDPGGSRSAFPPEGGFFQDPADPEARYLWRWVAFQAPDRVVVVRSGSRLEWTPAGEEPPTALPVALTRGRPSGLPSVPAQGVRARRADVPELMGELAARMASSPHSRMRAELVDRMEREPFAVAALLARRYPQNPAVGYIPATAWVAALRLAALTGDPASRDRVVSAMRPYLLGERPALSGTPDLVKLAGHMVFADLAQDRGLPGPERSAARRLALEAAQRYIPEGESDPARYGKYWTDDMYMQCCLLGRVGRLEGRSDLLRLAARTLRLYVPRLQRADGLFVHALDGPHCWGRGNGFASLGLMECLTALGAGDPDRRELLAAYQRQMAALRRSQTPEGTWRQVVDRPGAYREVTATAMNLTAMARGVRLGWLPGEYRAVVLRAWRGLSARIAADGALADVCTGTGSGPTLRYYYDRAGLFGLDDRGGAMALLAAVEVGQL
ncbi:MAG: hypothetical protein FJX77_14260, partial [Armatimonadetes bacterium]|nr:hypothetical protein [Armatimonadota bacterium]